MHHFVQCLESVIGSDVLVTEWRAFETDIEAPEATAAGAVRDLRWLALRHERFAAACAEGALLGFDQHLCNVVTRLLQVAVNAAGEIKGQLFGFQPGAGSVFERIGHEETWRAVLGLCNEVQERLDYARARLTRRSSNSILANLDMLLSVGGAMRSAF
jgi:Gamma tubulin complex component C-terminal